MSWDTGIRPVKDPAAAARDKAFDLLSRRSYGEQELYRKLMQKFEEPAAAAAVARMCELGLLNDMEYARRLAEHCMQNKGFAKSRTRQALREKGLDAELVDAVLEEMDDNPRAAIAAIVDKKYRQLGDEKVRRRAYNALMRLGYHHSDILAVLKEKRQDIPDSEDEA